MGIVWEWYGYGMGMVRVWYGYGMDMVWVPRWLWLPTSLPINDSGIGLLPHLIISKPTINLNMTMYGLVGMLKLQLNSLSTQIQSPKRGVYNDMDNEIDPCDTESECLLCLRHLPSPPHHSANSVANA